MDDFGANVGLLISSKGFQSESYKAAENTNLKLIDWIKFQQTFCERWYRNYFMPTLSKINEPLVDYTEPGKYPCFS
jgi:restriction system protein